MEAEVIVTATAIEYPVLCFSQGHLLVARDESSLTKCTYTGYKSGWFDDLVVVDASLKRFEVAAAERVRTGELSSWLERLFGKQFRVRITFKEPRSVDLGEVKRQAAECVRKDEEFWEAGGKTVSEWQSEIDAAGSMPELLRVLTLDAEEPIGI